jgi:trigger factor
MRVYDEQGKEIEFFNTPGADITLGGRQSFEAFEAFVKTLYVGEEGERTLLFPENFFKAEYAQRELLVHIGVNGLKERVLPELNDEFAAKIGKFDNLQAARDSIKESFLRTRKELNRNKTRQKLLDELVKLVEFPLPESLVAQMSSSILENRTKYMQATDDKEKIKEEALLEAQAMVKEYVFLHRVCLAEKIEVSENELIQYMAGLAARERRSPAAMRAEYINNNRLGELEDRIRSAKALDLLYFKARVDIVSLADAGGADANAAAESGADAVSEEQPEAAPEAD